VEPESFHITNDAAQEPSAPSGPYRAAKPRARATPREQRRLDDSTHLRLDAPAQVRLGLQRRAPHNLRRHVRRDATRFLALVVADLAAFGVMRALIRAVRDGAVFGGWLSGAVQNALPAGYMNGWQFAAALFVGLVVLGNYGPGDRRRDSGRLFLACALATALPLWTMLWARGLELVLLQYSVTVALVWAVVVAERLTVDRVIARFRSPERDGADTLFVGTAADCNHAASSPAFARGTEYRPIGFVDLHTPAGPGALGEIGDLPILLAASGTNVVVICGFLTPTQFRDVVDAALTSGCQVLSVPRVLAVAGVHPTTVWRNGQPLVELTAPGLKGQQLLVKRAIDVFGSMLGLVFLSPVYLIVALLVKWDSRGSVFFRQYRVGRGGRLFRIIKFRTMVDGAEEKRDELLSQSVYRDPRLFKMANDPRTTKLGGWLRRTSLDELPQLVNVLRGDMSLVGPRPPLPSEVALYEQHHYARFDVKPGMTGPWQVSGRNQITDFEKVIALETEYIRDWSLWSDLVIRAQTFVVVLRMQGAH
jgi:exopolysaccharide biosynthesis polyprenyl glycosylphosphotransferase